MSKKKKVPISILVVEDVAEMRGLVELVLREVQGFRVSGLAKNCSEARIMASRHRPHMVLLDEVLPGESSYDLLRELDQQGIRVLLMTSFLGGGSGAKEGRSLPQGALGRISKPGWESIEEDRARMQKLILANLGKNE